MTNTRQQGAESGAVALATAPEMDGFAQIGGVKLLVTNDKLGGVVVHARKGVFAFVEVATPEQAMRLGEELIRAANLADAMRGGL